MSLTTTEAATRLHIGEPAVRQMVRRRQLEPLRRGARPLEFDEAEVERALQRQWREQQRRSQLGDAWAECVRLLAGQAQCVSRSNPGAAIPGDGL